jgi:hypothetical protein
VLAVSLLGLVPGAASVKGQDLNAGLANAELRASHAEDAISARQDQLTIAEANYEAAARRSAPMQAHVRAAGADIESLSSELADREQRATGRISKLTAQHEREVDDHDQEVRSGVGFGLAALVAAGIALAWGWFRASAVVAAMSRMALSPAIGLCVGGGFVVLVLGAALGSATGVAGAVGSFIFCLGLILPVALLLGRHSAAVQRGQEKPLLGRERLPSWVQMTAAGLLVVAFLASAGSAVFADKATSNPVSARLREEAQAKSRGGGADELVAAREEAANLKQRAAAPVRDMIAARIELANARRGVGAAERSLTRAESSQQYFTRRLVALAAHEEREAVKAAEQAQQEEEELLEQQEEESAAECNPNYSGCLDPNSYDYDCTGGSGDGPDYTSTVEVTGYDEYGLDEDGDGIGCEPY